MPVDLNEHSIFAAAIARLATGDVQNARRLMREAANANYLPALQFYSAFVEYGVGGRPSPLKAMRWLIRASELGDDLACIRLAEMHLAQRNDGQAKFWLERALANSSYVNRHANPHAKLMLVRLYAKSRSVRATRRARGILSGLPLNSRLSDKESGELNQLREDFKTRTPDVLAKHSQMRAKLKGEPPKIEARSIDVIDIKQEGIGVLPEANRKKSSKKMIYFDQLLAVLIAYLIFKIVFSH